MENYLLLLFLMGKGKEIDEIGQREKEERGEERECDSFYVINYILNKIF